MHGWFELYAPSRKDGWCGLIWLLDVITGSWLNIYNIQEAVRSAFLLNWRFVTSVARIPHTTKKYLESGPLMIRSERAADYDKAVY
jgi:hypothetical protein